MYCILKKIRMYFQSKSHNRHEFDNEKTAHLLRLAEQGDANAQYKVGQMYEKGTGVTKDISEAQQWYQKASEQNQPKARLAYLKITLKIMKEL